MCQLDTGSRTGPKQNATKYQVYQVYAIIHAITGVDVELIGVSIEFGVVDD